MIQGDLHRPRFAGEFGLTTPCAGVEGVLSGQFKYNSEFQSDPNTELHCPFTVGSHPEPAELSKCDRLFALIVDVRTSYGRFVIDSPRVLHGSASVVFSLSRLADRIEQVAKAEHTLQSQVIEALNRFPVDRQDHLATLLTWARASRTAPQGYYAGYGDAPSYQGRSTAVALPRTPPALPMLDATRGHPVVER